MQCRLLAVLDEVSIEVTRHAVVAARIRAVGSDIHFDDKVALQVVVTRCGQSHLSILGQHDDAVVACSHSDFILGTNHSITLDATQFTLFDGKTLIPIIELAAQGSHHDLLSCRHIGSSAHNLHRFTLSQIDRCHVHVVAVGVRLARKHLTDHDTLETALDALHLFYTIYLQTRTRQCIGHFLRRHVEIDIFAQPFVRYIHLIRLINQISAQNYYFFLSLPNNT